MKKDLKKNCVCIIDLNEYLPNYNNWDSMLTALDNDIKSDVFIATHNIDLLHNSTLWEYLSTQELVDNIEVVEIDVGDIPDNYFKKMTLCSMCENLRVLYQYGNSESYGFYINVISNISFEGITLELNTFLNYADKLAIYHRDIFHTKDPIISALDLFCSNDSIIFSYLQNIIFYAKSQCVTEEKMDSTIWNSILKNNIKYGWNTGIDNALLMQPTDDSIIQLLSMNIAIMHLATPIFIKGYV